MCNGNVDSTRNYNPVGFTRFIHTKCNRKDQMRLKETGRYGVRIPDQLVVLTNKVELEFAQFVLSKEGPTLKFQPFTQPHGEKGSTSTCTDWSTHISGYSPR